ncbi:MAG: hypothetical protein H6983_13885 [Ectothiorhodospiraceae bacterium]|nr:hypothetical protein [Ectothiorhodospiraceae bacterium]
MSVSAPPRAPPARVPLQPGLEPVHALDRDTATAMHRLYHRYYAGADRARFEADLAAKHWALVLREPSGAVRGFSTFHVGEERVDDTPVRVVFSGDTVVDHRWWGQQALAFAWLRATGQLWAEAPERPLLWLLIVKGHRTYRYLGTFARTHVPHWTQPPDPWLRHALDVLAARRFGDAYDRERGVVAFGRSHGHLRPGWAWPDARERARPDVAFFLRRNPGFTRGEELACVTRLAPDNLRPLARRVFEQGMP